jgi:hypothetical protein
MFLLWRETFSNTLVPGIKAKDSKKSASGMERSTHQPAAAVQGNLSNRQVWSFVPEVLHHAMITKSEE